MNALVLSLYIGYALYEVFPFKDQLFGTGGTAAMRTILAIVLYAITVALSHFLLRKIGYRASGAKGLPLVVLAVLSVSFLLALGYNLFNLPHLVVLPTLVSQVWGPSQYFFWWFIAPIVGLFFLG